MNDTQQEQKHALIANLRKNVIGDNTFIQTPFGKRKLTYADYTASGRSLHFIEQAILHSVLPYYANTHTESTITGKQTTQFREDARHIIEKSVNATDEDLILFCGSGATAAINKLISMLNIPLLTTQHGIKPIVFIGPYEHHSNDLPWREAEVKLIRIPEAKAGGVDLKALEDALIHYQAVPVKIGCFSAASNVTGIKEDQTAITNLLHKHQALSFWDFAAAAPYVEIDMNPNVSDLSADNQALAYKDAIFFSCHKFIGGPGTPGILIIKKHLIKNTIPSTVGGGTVSFVSHDKHSYLPVGVRREEGGTPNIIESIRAGMVFKVKSDIGAEYIESLEQEYVNQLEDRWRNHPNIEILGASTKNRLTITSFRIKTATGYLHHGYIVALLNDLFGIQMRGGCSCAGPYGHELLGIDDQKSAAITFALSGGNLILKPGWARFNLNYFLSQEEVNFLFEAVEFVAENGIKLLPYYQYNDKSDLWLFQGSSLSTQSLFDALQSEIKFTEALTEQEKIGLWKSYLSFSKQLITDVNLQKFKRCHQPFNDDFESLREFTLAKDTQGT
ncbi:aminotransferase class V-fold PLP-dependent enzyme [Marinomonas sp. 15G1-11]|uniref:Aminotransferase class V-fold PLP-dependent enzyme n=1 Tax=Marinomonas phaeophyticola TaxID=3004091 RepID=A0ABT4JQK2_9GAMM|nr:aminotransferase class V-fold PLP-dependent enzyme [Marinomonas sp. 15G1-11]MCZ2720672.1 aminotransferase class V-fold PLP-dependent enzyme [Marinomonas sp. 15G1-11]